MAVKIPFKNPQTDEVRTVKVGWSWTLFFFTNFFGVPYFIRRLPRWGFLFLATSIIGNVFQVALGAQPILLLLSAGYLAIAIGMGLKGNEITAKAYLEKGLGLCQPGFQGCCICAK